LLYFVRKFILLIVIIALIRFEKISFQLFHYFKLRFIYRCLYSFSGQWHQKLKSITYWFFTLLIFSVSSSRQISCYFLLNCSLSVHFNKNDFDYIFKTYTGGPRNSRTFYLRIRLFAVLKNIPKLIIRGNLSLNPSLICGFGQDLP
jgi:hypothetical protein